MKMYNDVMVPDIGYGTWLVENEEASHLVKSALNIGYRMIDTASYYKNEEGVGLGIAESDLDRNEIFLTSKLWNDEQGYDNTLKAFEKSLSRLSVDYVDLYLVHWPIPAGKRDCWQKNMIETWHAMEEIYNSKRAKSIGVSNFLDHHLQFLSENCEIKPMVNQIEYHVGFTQDETVSYCKKNNIVVQAWSPLARGGIFELNEIEKIAKKYGKTSAQICLAWEMQKGIVPIPKTKTLKRMEENLESADIILENEDILLLDSIKKCSNSGLNPDNIDF